MAKNRFSEILTADSKWLQRVNTNLSLFSVCCCSFVDFLNHFRCLKRWNNVFHKENERLENILPWLSSCDLKVVKLCSKKSYIMNLKLWSLSRFNSEMWKWLNKLPQRWIPNPRTQRKSHLWLHCNNPSAIIAAAATTTTTTGSQNR